MDKNFDVLIIGAGVVGSAAARELARYQLKIGVLEKTPDVCCGTSGRNSGVLHAGFNNKPGTLMACFCVEGNAELAEELDIPYRRTIASCVLVQGGELPLVSVRLTKSVQEIESLM